MGAALLPRYSPRLAYSAALFALVLAAVVLARPAAVFDPATGRPRPFGAGPGETLLSLGVVTVLAALLSAYAFLLVDACVPTRS